MKILTNKKYKKILTQSNEGYKKGYEVEIDKLYRQIEELQSQLDDVYLELVEVSEYTSNTKKETYQKKIKEIIKNYWGGNKNEKM